MPSFRKHVYTHCVCCVLCARLYVNVLDLRSSCLVCVELPLLLVLLVTSLSVSINTSIGLALACKAFNDANENDSFFKASGSE